MTLTPRLMAPQWQDLVLLPKLIELPHGVKQFGGPRPMFTIPDPPDSDNLYKSDFLAQVVCWALAMGEDELTEGRTTTNWAQWLSRTQRIMGGSIPNHVAQAVLLPINIRVNPTQLDYLQLFLKPAWIRAHAPVDPREIGPQRWEPILQSQDSTPNEMTPLTLRVYSKRWAAEVLRVHQEVALNSTSGTFLLNKAVQWIWRDNAGLLSPVHCHEIWPTEGRPASLALPDFTEVFA